MYYLPCTFTSGTVCETKDLLCEFFPTVFACKQHCNVSVQSLSLGSMLGYKTPGSTLLCSVSSPLSLSLSLSFSLSSLSLLSLSLSFSLSSLSLLSLSLSLPLSLSPPPIFQRSMFRNFLMYGFHLLVYVLCVRGIRDTQCGFKLFTRSAAACLFKSIHINRW